MREIEFRAKKLTTHDENKWAFGYLLYGDEQNAAFIAQAFKDKSSYIRPVFPETIGQFTGLTDKNGKKIFEGDILHSEQYPFVYNGNRNYFAVVVWVKDQALFGIEYYKYPESKVLGDCIGNFETFSNVDSSDYEVIGNIHDNPELLEEQ